MLSLRKIDLFEETDLFTLIEYVGMILTTKLMYHTEMQVIRK